MTRILIVDDNVDSRVSLATLCGLWGYETALAGDGGEGLAVWAAFAPDVVVLDLGLPGVDGWEVARRIRAEAGGTVYIIVMSGYGTTADIARAGEASCDEFLVKPANLDKLHNLLSAAAARVAAQGRAR